MGNKYPVRYSRHRFRLSVGRTHMWQGPCYNHSIIIHRCAMHVCDFYFCENVIIIEHCCACYSTLKIRCLDLTPNIMRLETLRDRACHDCTTIAWLGSLEHTLWYHHKTMFIILYNVDIHFHASLNQRRTQKLTIMSDIIARHKLGTAISWKVK